MSKYAALSTVDDDHNIELTNSKPMNADGKGDHISIKVMQLGGQVFCIHTSLKTNGASLKGVVRSAPEMKEVVSSNKRLRLIFQGKMIDDNAMLDKIGIYNDCVVHCVVSDASPLPPPVAVTIDPSNTHSSSNGNVGSSFTGDRPRRRGFDILLDHGFDAEEVAGLRIRFNPEVDITENMLDVVEGESASDRRLRAEEIWHTSSQSSYHGAVFGQEVVSEGPPVGTNADFVWGFVMSILLGVLMLFWMADRNGSKKQKLGIICGFFAKAVIEILYAQQQPGAAGST